MHVSKHLKLGLLALLAVEPVTPVSGQEGDYSEQEVLPDLAGDWVSNECALVAGGHPLTYIDGYSYRQGTRIREGPADFTVFNFWYADDSCRNLVEIHEPLIRCKETGRTVESELLRIAFSCHFAATDLYTVYLIPDQSTTPEDFMLLGQKADLWRIEVRFMGGASFDYDSTLETPNIRNPNHFTNEGSRYERLIPSER